MDFLCFVGRVPRHYGSSSTEVNSLGLCRFTLRIRARGCMTAKETFN